MPVTQSDIDALNAAIASGERRVTLGSQSITYATIGELIQARDDMKRQLIAQEPTAPRRRTLMYYGGRGYN
ncbi:MAG: phage head-tail joining protein [Solimonas sp.]